MIKNIKTILSFVFLYCIHFLNVLLPKKDIIFFYTFKNSKIDGYNIINYTADNVLCMFHSMISDPYFKGYQFHVICYDMENVPQYQYYLNKNFPGRVVKFVNGDNRWDKMWTFMKSRVCFTGFIIPLPFRSKEQLVISLGYYTPFKDDFWNINRFSPFIQFLFRIERNKQFSHFMVTSGLSGRIISVDTLLDYSKFICAGYPRNDIFYRDNSKFREKLIKQVGQEVKSIICYTPTYRDFERLDLPKGDHSLIKMKSIFGYVTEEEEKKLLQTLKKNNAIIIAKVHPWQNVDIINKKNYDNVVITYSDLTKHMTVSLYDIMAVSDMLITDYTSASFDYMHSNKPIIYYFYDFDEYQKNRDFSFSPIQSVCGGKIVYSIDDLSNSIERTLHCENKPDEQKRIFVHDLINELHDGNSAERIKTFIKDKIINI